MRRCSLRRAGGILLPSLVLACARGPRRPPQPEPEVRVPADGRGIAVVDRESDIFPDPLQRTAVRMAAVQNVANQFLARHGRMPDSLAEFLPAPGPGPIDLWHDADGTPFRYTRRGDDFELRAAGPDLQFGTVDDQVASRTTDIPIPLARRAPGERTRTTMVSIQMLVTVYESRTGALPRRLEDLPAAGLRPYLGTDDEWGRPIEFSRSRDDFELRSAGPDGQLGTDDDLRVRGRDSALRKTP